jgi:pimeloyl-ACP methyl ester carboxylesterase
MVNYFRKEMRQPIVGTHKSIPEPIESKLKRTGFGHSMGGAILINVALMHPRLFTTVVNFEASICRSPRQYTTLPGYFITFRKDQWPSRDAAAKYLSKHPLYKTWDPAVLDLFLQYGLRDGPTLLYPNALSSGSSVPVTLTTSKHQEITDYTRAAFPPDRSTPIADFQPTANGHPDIGDASWRHPKEAFYRPETTLMFPQLPYLRPSCLWLYGSDSTFMSDRANRQDKTNVTGTGIGGSGGVAAGRVKEIDVSGGGHYLPLEAPRKLAVEVLGPWFDTEVERWVKETEEERKEWESVALEKRSQVSDDFLYWMKTHNDPRKVTKAMRLKL